MLGLRTLGSPGQALAHSWNGGSRGLLGYYRFNSMAKLASLALGVIVTVLAAWMLGALMASLVSIGWLGFALACLAGILLCIALPVWIDRKLLVSARRDDPKARSMLGQALLIINGIVLGVLLFAVPRFTRTALEVRGDWVLFSPRSSTTPSPMLEVVRGFAKYIPRSSAPAVEALPAASASGSAAPGDPRPAASARKVAEVKAKAADQELGVQGGIASASSAAAQGALPLSQAVEGPAQVFRKYADSVVIITARGEAPHDSPFGELFERLGIPSMDGFGSGFIVGTDGLIATNHHVIEGAQALSVKLRNGKRYNHVQRLADLPGHDLALIKIRAQGLRQVALAANDAVEVGDPAIAIGCPQGLEYSLTTGIVSALRQTNKTAMIQMQTTIAPGSSGGPLFSNRGELLGVNTASQGAGLNYAVRVQHVRELVALPRQPHDYDPYQGGLRVLSFETRGIDAGPTLRANLSQGFVLWGNAIKRCAGQLPEKASIDYHFRDSSLMAQPAATSDPESLAQCNPAFITMLATQAKLLILQAHSSSFAKGFSIAVTLGGIDNAAEAAVDPVEEDAEPDLTLTLHFGPKPDEPAAP